MSVTDSLHLADACNEQARSYVEPTWSVVPAEYGGVTYLGRYRFGLSQRHAEMYFAPESPDGTPGLILLFERTPDKVHFAALDEIGGAAGGPALKQAFKAAHDCAQRKGFVP